VWLTKTSWLSDECNLFGNKDADKYSIYCRGTANSRSTFIIVLLEIFLMMMDLVKTNPLLYFFYV